jgi:hypothetical protein
VDAVSPTTAANDAPTLAFIVEERQAPAIEIRVNFGVFAGRMVTSAEIDRLAEWLLDEVGGVTIVSEDRHEIGKEAGASTHQVRIEVGGPSAPVDRGEFRQVEQRCLERTDYWARTCIADRHVVP